MIYNKNIYNKECKFSSIKSRYCADSDINKEKFNGYTQLKWEYKKKYEKNAKNKVIFFTTYWNNGKINKGCAYVYFTNNINEIEPNTSKRQNVFYIDDKLNVSFIEGNATENQIVEAKEQINEIFKYYNLFKKKTNKIKTKQKNNNFKYIEFEKLTSFILNDKNKKRFPDNKNKNEKFSIPIYTNKIDYVKLINENRQNFLINKNKNQMFSAPINTSNINAYDEWKKNVKNYRDQIKQEKENTAKKYNEYINNYKFYH